MWSLHDAKSLGCAVASADLMDEYHSEGLLLGREAYN